MADNTLHSSARANWLERRFALRSRGGTLRTECLAGITGFLAAAYLLVVIPGLLAIGGMDKGAATTGTILVFVVGSLLMLSLIHISEPTRPSHISRMPSSA